MIYLFLFVSFLCLAHCNSQLHLQCGYISSYYSCEYLLVNHVIIFPIPGLCSSPSLYAHYRQHCLVEKPLSWSEYCREGCFDLATLGSMGAMKALQPLISNTQDVWLGRCGVNPMGAIGLWQTMISTKSVRGITEISR